DGRRNGKRIAEVDGNFAIRAPTSTLALLLGRGRLGCRGGCCSRRAGRCRCPFRGGAFGTLSSLLGLLGLLQDDLLYPNLGQAERAPPLGPFFSVLQLLDPLGPREHAPVGGARRPALQGFVDGHSWPGIRGQGSGVSC